VRTRDLENEAWRLSVLADVVQAAQLCDALPEIDFVMSFALPHDVPDENVETQQYYAISWIGIPYSFRTAHPNGG
jgi:hypothetical protein